MVGATPHDVVCAAESAERAGRPGIASELARIVNVSERTMQYRVRRALEELGEMQDNE